MLLGYGRAAGRHVTSPTHSLRALVPRSFHSFQRLHDAPQLPYVQDFSFRPSIVPNPSARQIAVLGGGLTGLTTAYELARTIPDAKITVYEKSSRLGGWLDSEIVKVDDGEVVFEWGARSFRPSSSGSGWATTLLLSRLADSTMNRGEPSAAAMLGEGKNAGNSKNRYLYYPDHLVRMPTTNNIFMAVWELIQSLLSEPIWKGVMSGWLREPTRPVRSLDIQDESLGNFLSRRYGRPLADNIASGVMHGIYAGDIYQMSARTILPTAWYLETREPDAGGVGMAMLNLFTRSKSLRAYEDRKFEILATTPQTSPLPQSLGRISRMLTDLSFATWADGMSNLPRSLERELELFPNVTIQKGAEVSSLTFDKSRQKVEVGDQQFDYAVSTLSPRMMNSILKTKTFEPIDKSVTVMVVNLYYRPPLSIPYKGFGYLIPQSVPFEQNPERALGVIFAHHSSGYRGQAAVEHHPRWKMIGRLEDWKSALRTMGSARALLESEKIRRSSDQEAMRAFELNLEQLTKSEERTQKLIADHEAGKGEDLDVEVPVRIGQDTVEGLKFTVMLGGHWWSGWEDGDYPSEEKAIEMAKSVLRRHLDIQEEPTIAKARLQRNCIPQYPVGYRQYMADIHESVKKDFDGRLKLAGPFYQGAVGVNDCIRRGILTAINIREGWDQNTGAEHYAGEEKWLLKDRDSGRLEVDPMNI